MGDFRFPEGGHGMPQSCGNAKKRRRNSSLVSMNLSSPTSEMHQMMGDTMFANNPFEDGNGGAIRPIGGLSGMIGPSGPMMGPGGLNNQIMNGSMMNGSMMNGSMMNGSMMNVSVMNGSMMNGSMMNGSMINGSERVMGHMGPGGPIASGPGSFIGPNSHMGPMGPGMPFMSENGPLIPSGPIDLNGPMRPNGSMETMGPAGDFSQNSPMGQGRPMGPGGPMCPSGPMGPGGLMGVNGPMGPGGSAGCSIGPTSGMGLGGPMPMSSLTDSFPMSSISGPIARGPISNSNMGQTVPMVSRGSIGHGGPNGMTVLLSNGVASSNPGQGTHDIPISSMCGTLGPGMSPISMSSGKIYPPDQPMVFNPKNPNAPPIYPCGICHREVHDNDQAILCESGCNFWFHRVCTGLAEAAFHYLTQEIYAEWVCDKCFSQKDVPLVKFKP